MIWSLSKVLGKTYVWIYENGAKELDPKHPQFSLISLNLKAFFKPSKRVKIEKGGQWKEDKRVEEGKKDWLSF